MVANSVPCIELPRFHKRFGILDMPSDRCKTVMTDTDRVA